MSIVSRPPTPAHTQVTEQRKRCGDYITDFWKKNIDTMMMLDPSSKVEMALFDQMYNHTAKQMLHKCLLKELPDIGRPEPLHEVLVALERIKDTAIYHYASDVCKSSVNIVVEWVRCLALSSPPSFTAVGDDPALKVLQRRLGFLLRHCTPATEDGAQDTLVFGPAALAARMQDIQALIEAKQPVDLGMLKPFDAFSWMMSENQKRQHAGWVQAIFASKSDAAIPQRTTRIMNNSTPPASKDSDKKRKASASTMDLFKRKRTT